VPTLLAPETISAVANLLTAAAVVVGVWVAHRQLNSWQHEREAVQLSELAIDLISTAYEVNDHFNAVRSPVGYGPPEGEPEDSAYDFRRRVKELANMDGKFAALRNLKIKQRAIFGSDEVDEAIEVFFQNRGKLFVALQGLIREHSRPNHSKTKQTWDRIHKYEDIVWDGSSEDDTIAKKQKNALSAIETVLRPLARMQGTKK
jgi:hypothetical protein